MCISDGLPSPLNSVVLLSFHCCQFVNPQSYLTHAAFNYGAAQGYETMLNVINKLYPYTPFETFSGLQIH